MERKLDHITYESVGIDPKAFYAGKFPLQRGRANLMADPTSKYDIEFDRLRLLIENVRGPNVLDIGCGSGPYGGSLRANCGIERLVGVDMDKKSVKAAKKSYHEAQVLDLEQGLPFPDGTFDSVFSVDLFGHIEFKNKDRLIREIHRVTRPGGSSVHIVESGYAAYETMDPNDPEDPTRKYIWQEGHIGVETVEEMRRRWKELFSIVRIENAFIYPFFPLSAYAQGSEFPEEFKALIAGFSDQQTKAAQIVMGFVSIHMKNEMRRRDPELLVPDHESADLLRRPCGLVYWICERRP